MAQLHDSYYDDPSISRDSYAAPSADMSGLSIASPTGNGYDHQAHSAAQGGVAQGGQYQNGVAVSQASTQPSRSQRKKLATWVGFSNLPGQVHRRSMK